MFHGGLTRKQFITLGYAYLVDRSGMTPTCRNIMEVMASHGAIPKDTSKASGAYRKTRSTMQQLEAVHSCVKAKKLGAVLAPTGIKPPYGFYPTSKGVDIIKTYMEGG